jgi:hypothetical protein
VLLTGTLMPAAARWASVAACVISWKFLTVFLAVPLSLTFTPMFIFCVAICSPNSCTPFQFKNQTGIYSLHDYSTQARICQTKFF